MRCLRWSALPISALVLLAPTGQQNEAVTLPLVGQAMAQTGTPQPSLGRVGQGYKQDYPQGHEPLQLLPKTASPSKTTAIKLGCSNVDSVLRPLCELSEALLNRTCESIHDRDQKFACNLALLGESEHDQVCRPPAQRRARHRDLHCSVQGRASGVVHLRRADDDLRGAAANRGGERVHPLVELHLWRECGA